MSECPIGEVIISIVLFCAICAYFWCIRDPQEFREFLKEHYNERDGVERRNADQPIDFPCRRKGAQDGRDQADAG